MADRSGNRRGRPHVASENGGGDSDVRARPHVLEDLGAARAKPGASGRAHFVMMAL